MKPKLKTMSNPSPAKQKVIESEKVNLDAFVNGNDGPDEKEIGALTVSEYGEISAMFKDMAKEFLVLGSSLTTDGYNAAKAHKKPATSRWKEYFYATIIGISALFCIFAIFNPWSLIPDNLKDKAGSVLIQLPIVGLSYFAGKSNKD
jgi:hypothetical protein